MLTNLLKILESKKIIVALLFWACGTAFYVLTLTKVFPTGDANFDKWASFTEWIGGILFVTHAGQTAVTAFAAPVPTANVVDKVVGNG